MLNEKLTLRTTELQKIKRQYKLQKHLDPLSEIKGHSLCYTKCKGLALKVAKTDATVLIYGKVELERTFAQGIHEASLRKEQPFIPINCGAIPEALLKVNFRL